MIRESEIPSIITRSDDYVKELQGLDFPTPPLVEAIRLICDSWQLGINNDKRFRVLLNLMKRLLDESGAGGGAGERHAIGEEQYRFDVHWQGGAEKNPRDIEQDDSSAVWSEGSDARSMAYSAHTVRSVTSFKEKTSQLVWPRNETRDKR